MLPLCSYHLSPYLFPLTITSPCFSASSHRCRSQNQKHPYLFKSLHVKSHCLPDQVQTPWFHLSPFSMSPLPFHLFLCPASKPTESAVSEMFSLPYLSSGYSSHSKSTRFLLMKTLVDCIIHAWVLWLWFWKINNCYISFFPSNSKLILNSNYY